MKFKTFLAESDDIDVFLKDLKSNCSEFLSQTKFPLYRGMRGKPDFGFDEAKDNREPKDSKDNPIFNNLFNLGAELITGISLIRRKAYFCSNSRDDARQYGNTYFIFPSNGGKYFYSPEIEDSLEDIHTHHMLLSMRRFGNDIYDKDEDQSYYEKFYNFIDNKREIEITVNDCQKKIKDVEGFLNIIEKEFKIQRNYELIDDISKLHTTQTSEILCVGSKKYYRLYIRYIEEFLNMNDNTNDEVYDKLLEKINEA